MLRLSDYIFKPYNLVVALNKYPLCKIIPDSIMIRCLYRQRIGIWPNLSNPVTFNEKINWLKLHDRNPLYATLVDKYAVKDYVKSLIGNETIIPTLGVWNSFDEIDIKELPEKFVLKCTHDSGSVVFINRREDFFSEEVRYKLKHALSNHYYKLGREWAYKGVRPRIIAEEMLTSDGEGINDYKIFCFNGIPRLIQVDFNRFSDHKRNLYTPEWDFVDAMIEYPNDKSHFIEKPARLGEMLSFSEILSKNIPHARIDFYYVNKKIYFGEITLYHGDGLEHFAPDGFGELIGSWLILPSQKKE